MPEENRDPEQVVKNAAIDVDGEGADEDLDDAVLPKKGRKRAPAVERPFPRKTLEEALRVPTAIRTHNGGKPYAPSEVAKALGVGMSGNFFYLTAAARDYGLTEGTREAQAISLTELGRQAVYPGSDQQRSDAMLKAFFTVDLFRKIVEHYGGSELPGDDFVRNTLETEYNLDPRTHDEFLDLFEKNCRFIGVGAEFPGTPAPAADRAADSPAGGAKVGPARSRPNGERPVCFVAMPFSEKTEKYPIGFFEEVFASLLRPAIEAAGFDAKTAMRQGSDIIHATIINELLDADLVLVDLTEHNPNVLFELGVRLAKELPTVLVRAKGTNPIFDVDNVLRVETYNPNLWPSTVEKDIPKLTAHVEAQWSRRESDTTYMSLLRRE
jgi:hypothetical protein